MSAATFLRRVPRRAGRLLAGLLTAGLVAPPPASAQDPGYSLPHTRVHHLRRDAELDQILYVSLPREVFPAALTRGLRWLFRDLPGSR